MIGAVIFKPALRGAMNDLNGRRKEKIVSNCEEDAVFICPRTFSMNGSRKGKAAMGEYLDRCFDVFVEEHCVAREPYIKNLFALGLTNTIAIRFHPRRTNNAGIVLENTEMTALKTKNGKLVELQDFYFDVETLQKMWSE